MKIVKLIAACLVMLLQISCSTNKVLETHSSSIQDNISILASKDLEGRLTGTEGNKTAQEFIVTTFKDIGLKPFMNDSFLHEYKHIYLPPEKQNYHVKIEFSKESIKELKYGEDFLEQNNIMNINMAYPVVFNLYDEKINESILVIDDIGRLSEYYKNENKIVEPKAILVKTQIFKKLLSMQEKGIPIIQITPKIYDELLNNPNSKVHIFQKLNTEEIQANNVIGMIEGYNNEKAIIISAHFDHVGKLDNNKVFCGAIDNASGVSALIKLGKKLQLYYNDNKPNYDILFCAFNGEESNRQGSKAFAKDIQKKYSEIVNINIDSIGIKGDNVLAIAGDEEVSGLLITDILNFFKQNQINSIMENTDLVSDHISFSEAQIPSVNLGNLKTDNIHTTNDTIAELDVDYIIKLTNVLHDFIVNSQSSIFSKEDINQHAVNKNEEIEYVEDEHIMNLHSEAKEGLPFGSYKIIMLENKPFPVIQKSGEFNNLQSIKDIYTDMKLPEEYNGYSFWKVIISDNTHVKIYDGIIEIGTLLIDKKSYEIGKEYKMVLDRKNINRVSLTYRMNSIEDKGAFVIDITQSFQFNSEYPEELETKTMTLNDLKYTLVYDKNTKIVWDINTEKEVGSNIYSVSLLKGGIITVDHDNSQIQVIKSDLSIDELNSIEDFIKSIDIEYFINAIWG
ncbi:peptidase family protein [Proteiniborus sp. DW1]|uniref:M28 family peptidase n=1 Tax=Proteiniborus sp. DW1 TaxID=1889883 RepID=UPI00092E0438|nr:M28 family peptidase [Proteiniborus sp. DW1]SCG82228.1 peptidase family protein [Proteiniborus sp. DW1]